MICGVSQAALTVTADPSEPQVTDAITSFSSNGITMAGMNVTFTGSVNEDLVWGPVTGPPSHGVDGAGWRLTQEYDTYSNPWTLYVDENTTMTSLLIDGGPGNTVFDWLSADEFTPGSSLGGAFTFGSTTADDLSDWAVKYYGPVSVAPADHQGDLYRYMLITPDAPWNGEVKFIADTDTATVTPVPVPSALLLAGLGSGVAGFFRRRQWS